MTRSGAFMRMVGLWLCAAAAARAQDTVDPGVRRFLGAYCITCHGPEKQKADFRVDTMLKPSRTTADAEYWQLVADKLNLGEMPPAKAAQPPALERTPVLEWIEGELRRARRALAGEAGEVVLRRLNRMEYEHTIEDLFGVRGDFAEGFPADAVAEGFDNNGGALMLSAEQVAQYLRAADEILKRAIVTRPRPKTESAGFTLADLNRKLEESEKKRQEYERKNPPSETDRKRQEENRKQGNHGPHYYPAFGGDHLIPMRTLKPTTKDLFHVREAGWYRFKVAGYAARNPAASPLRLHVDHGSFRQGTVPAFAGIVQYTDAQPRESEFRLYLEPNDQVRLSMLDGPNWMWGSRIAENEEPVIALRRIEIEGPLIDEWPPKGHRLLLGARDATALKDEEVPALLAELAPRLFRRPAPEEAVRDYVAFYRQAREGTVPLEAFTSTVRAMMASPHFLYHVETGPAPDAHALANRLSYFLWRSAPDGEMSAAAAAGRLSKPDEVRRQIDRLLADERSERFLRDFVGQWLGIRRVGEMQPDTNLYPEYDDDLERAMVEETRGFVRELLQKDLSLANLIDSDWTILNDRLARHYGIPGVEGAHFRRVALDKAKTVRGGLLTQAGILNVTSNGTVTSPVVRGVWVLNRLLGTPASPPPPDVPALEPDIRGAATIQEQLAKHRTIEQCASCHRKIDPYGMALENFDVVGGWRENYRALAPSANPNRPKRVDGQKVVCKDEIPGLGAFEDFRAFRSLLARREGLIYENVARTLATFALGRAMGFADEEAIKGVAARTRAKRAGLRTMIRELASGELFRKP